MRPEANKLASVVRASLKEQLLTERILVVGAGFAGATYAREAVESGHLIDAIDSRGSIGGNAFDETLDDGIPVQRSGSHLLHTNYDRVVEWLRQFRELVFCTHCVCAPRPNGQPLVLLPVNRRTVNEALP